MMGIGENGRMWIMTAVAAGLMASGASAALIHTDTLPAGVNASAKSSGNFIYLEGEREQYTQSGLVSNDPYNGTVKDSGNPISNDTLSDSGDAGHYIYRTDQTNYSNFHATILDGSRYGDRVAKGQSLYWIDVYDQHVSAADGTNLPKINAQLAEGQYDVYVHAYYNERTKDVDNVMSFYAGTNKAGVDGGAVIGSATTDTDGAKWYKLGTVNLDSSIDSFKLLVAPSDGASEVYVQIDSILLVPVPEPASAGLIGSSLLGLLAVRRRNMA